MKKVLAAVAVLAACLMLTPMAWAAVRSTPTTPNPGTPHHFLCTGPVSAVDTGLSTLTLTVHKAGGPAHQLAGEPLTVLVTADTQIYAVSHTGKTAIALGDIKVGDRAAVCGTVDMSNPDALVYTASRVLVQHVVHHFLCTGPVGAVDTGLSTLTLTVHKAGGPAHQLAGEPLTVLVTADTQIYAVSHTGKTAIGLGDIKVGDRAAVCGTVDMSNPDALVYTAKLILDHRSAPPAPYTAR